jgi:O-antigen/teichoic acid export membrane protein
VITTLPERGSAGTLVGNAAFILASDVVNRAATFALYALIARHLGAVEVGQMALALALFYVMQMFAAAGLKTVITREIAKDRRATDRCLASGIGLVTLSSALSVAALAGFVRAIGYARDTASIVLLLGLALWPYATSAVCEAVFQAWEKMRYIAYAQVPVHVIRVCLAYWLLVEGRSIYQLALLLLASHVAIASVEWWLMLRYVARPHFESFAQWIQSSLGMARSASTFLAIDGLSAVNGSINIVLLSALATEKAVGLYSAASQLLAPIALVYQSAVLSMFPTLCRRIERGIGGTVHVLERVLALLLALAVPTAVGLFFLAEPALRLLYGDRGFVLASPVLRIVVWLLIPGALTTVLGQVFLASDRERLTLRIIAVNTLVGVLTGAIFITNFGLIGAAIAAVLTKTVDFFQHYIPVSRLVPTIRLHRLGWKPVVAVICMAGYLAWATNQWVILTAAAAGALYLGVLLALAVWSAGGLRQLKTRSLQVWPE